MELQSKEISTVGLYFCQWQDKGVFRKPDCEPIGGTDSFTRDPSGEAMWSQESGTPKAQDLESQLKASRQGKHSHHQHNYQQRLLGGTHKTAPWERVSNHASIRWQQCRLQLYHWDLTCTAPYRSVLKDHKQQPVSGRGSEVTKSIVYHPPSLVHGESREDSQAWNRPDLGEGRSCKWYYIGQDFYISERRFSCE